MVVFPAVLAGWEGPVDRVAGLMSGACLGLTGDKCSSALSKIDLGKLGMVLYSNHACGIKDRQSSAVR